jgi:transposase-like protein
LDPAYPVLLIDAIFVRIRDGQLANRAIYVAMGITIDGERDVLGNPRSSLQTLSPGEIRGPGHHRR